MNTCLESGILRRSITCVTVILKRYRYKKKWATNVKMKPPSALALQYFDTYYKPVYGPLWPSMRIALLSQQKYCALINNFADSDSALVSLIESGADDFVHNIATRNANAAEIHGENTEDIDLTYTESSSEPGHDSALENQEEPHEETANIQNDLYEFMPVKRVLSEKEELQRQEMQQGFYRPSEFEVKTQPDDAHFQLPHHLKACVHERGNVSLFPTPRKDNADKLNYYLMDAACLLPVIALGLEPDSKVLDLCAAPGGKTLAILQTLATGSLTCADRSFTRLQRLHETLRWYTPRSLSDDGTVQVLHRDAAKFTASLRGDDCFDKVLVDTPCYTDRHVLLEDDNNMFRPSRMSERLQIQEIQKHLLVAGIHCCKPGGTVVYSTCTLSPPQNDGVIQSALELLWQQTNIDVVVQDISHLADTFSNTFNFFGNCRFGQLVLPNLTANFGPMYFCKLKRLN